MSNLFDFNQKLKMGEAAISSHPAYFNTTSGKQLLLDIDAVLIPLYCYEVDFTDFLGPGKRVRALVFHDEVILDGWISYGTSHWFQTIE